MSVVNYTKDGILTICLTDARLTDEAKLEQLGGELIKQLNDTTEERVILDFHNVQFMSSSMLGKLVQLQKKCKEFKVHLKLAAISPDIRQVFKITKLDKLFEIEDDEASGAKPSCVVAGSAERNASERTCLSTWAVCLAFQFQLGPLGAALYSLH